MTTMSPNCSGFCSRPSVLIVYWNICPVGAGGWLMVQAVRAQATPGTMLKMAAYLASDDAGIINGETLMADGGFTIR